MKNLFSIATIIVLGFATTHVANADPQSPRTLTVQFGDLDLNKPKGVEVLFKRIRNAAEDVCSEFEGRAPKEKGLHSVCVEQALSTAVAHVNRPVLSQYLVERTAKSRKVPVPVVSRR